jgi:hypothetical protein
LRAGVFITPSTNARKNRQTTKWFEKTKKREQLIERSKEKQFNLKQTNRQAGRTKESYKRI